MADGILGLQGSSGAASAMSAAATKTNADAAAQKNQFLKLLTMQLKSQNPMKPYDNQEFASQLAQFSQLEQLSGIKSLLEEQNKTNMLLSQTMSNSALPGMLGKSAKAYSSHVINDGTNPVNMGFELSENMEEGVVSILNENGSVVKKFNVDASELNRGEHTFQWDGTDQAGNKVPKGTYTYFADFKNSEGTKSEAKTYSYGTVEAVRFKSEGTMLVIGGLEVPLADVTDIATRN